MSESFILFVDSDPSSVFDSLRKPGFTKIRRIDADALLTGEIGRIDGEIRFVVSRRIVPARMRRTGPVSRWKLVRA